MVPEKLQGYKLAFKGEAKTHLYPVYVVKEGENRFITGDIYVVLGHVHTPLSNASLMTWKTFCRSQSSESSLRLLITLFSIFCLETSTGKMKGTQSTTYL